MADSRSAQPVAHHHHRLLLPEPCTAKPAQLGRVAVRAGWQARSGGKPRRVVPASSTADPRGIEGAGCCSAEANRGSSALARQQLERCRRPDRADAWPAQSLVPGFCLRAGTRLGAFTAAAGNAVPPATGLRYWDDCWTDWTDVVNLRWNWRDLPASHRESFRRTAWRS